MRVDRNTGELSKVEQEIADLFKPRPPRDGHVEEDMGEHRLVERVMQNATLQIYRRMPNGPEVKLFLEHMQMASFWANAGIARERPPAPEKTGGGSE